MAELVTFYGVVIVDGAPRASQGTAKLRRDGLAHIQSPGPYLSGRVVVNLDALARTPGEAWRRYIEEAERRVNWARRELADAEARLRAAKEVENHG